MPLVSVIVPTYNRPQLLERSLTCIDSQTFRDYELIVVNDAGVDVEGIVSRHRNARYVLNPTNAGLAATRNAGLAQAQGKYIAYQDDDDIWFPEHLQVLVEHLESLPHIRAAYTGCYRWYSEHYLVPGNEERLPNVGMKARQIMAIICLMHDHRLLDEIGVFDESMREMEDWDFIFRLNRAVDVLKIPVYTAAYSKRLSPDQLSVNKERMRAAMDKIKQKYQVEEVGFFGDPDNDSGILHAWRAKDPAVA